MDRKSLERMRNLFYMEHGCFTGRSWTCEEMLKEVVRVYGDGWTVVKPPVVDRARLASVTEFTKHPVPVSYYLPLIADSDFDYSIYRTPGRRRVEAVLAVLDKGEMEDVDYMIAGMKYKVCMVRRVPVTDYLTSVGLYGGYCVDLGTSIRLMRSGVIGMENSPYSYRFVVNGKKHFSPVCCLSETPNNVYARDLSQMSVGTMTIDSCLNALCRALGDGRENRDVKWYGGYPVCGVRVEIGGKKIMSEGVSERECKLDVINKILDYYGKD